MEILPSSFANFHLLTEGSCWVRTGGGEIGEGIGGEVGEECIEMNPGELVVFPHGSRHTLLGAPTDPVRPAEQMVEVPRSRDPLTLGGQGDRTAKMVYGHFEFDETVRHPLRASLPAFLHLGPDQGGWAQPVAELAAAEAASGAPGSEIVVDRLAETLMIHVIRGLIRTHRPAGFLAALRDPQVAQTLAMIHARYREEWTVEGLANSVGSSRSALASRFRQSTGMGVIQYLRMWRLIQARQILSGGSSTVRAAARKVGYDSEWAFSKAFKRAFGYGPGEARRSGSPIS